MPAISPAGAGLAVWAMADPALKNRSIQSRAAIVMRFIVSLLCLTGFGFYFGLLPCIETPLLRQAWPCCAMLASTSGRYLLRMSPPHPLFIIMLTSTALMPSKPLCSKRTLVPAAVGVSVQTTTVSIALLFQV